MIEVNLERLRTHRANIVRYRRLLATRLTDLERAYIERRLSEEQASVKALLQEAFPERLCARWAKKNTRTQRTWKWLTAAPGRRIQSSHGRCGGLRSDVVREAGHLVFLGRGCLRCQRCFGIEPEH